MLSCLTVVMFVNEIVELAGAVFVLFISRPAVSWVLTRCRMVVEVAAKVVRGTLELVLVNVARRVVEVGGFVVEAARRVVEVARRVVEVAGLVVEVVGLVVEVAWLVEEVGGFVVEVVVDVGFAVKVVGVLVNAVGLDGDVGGFVVEVASHSVEVVWLVVEVVGFMMDVVGLMVEVVRVEASEVLGIVMVAGLVVVEVVTILRTPELPTGSWPTPFLSSFSSSLPSADIVVVVSMLVDFKP